MRWSADVAVDKVVRPSLNLALGDYSPVDLLLELVESLRELAPQRMRDVSRVLGNALYNFFTLLQSDRGLRSRRDARRFLDAWVGASSSPAAG